MIRRDERPDTSAETGAKRGRRIRTELTRHANQANRLGHLVAEQALDSILRSRYFFADRCEIAARKRSRRLRDDVVRLGAELIESVE